MECPGCETQFFDGRSVPHLNICPRKPVGIIPLKKIIALTSDLRKINQVVETKIPKQVSVNSKLDKYQFNKSTPVAE